jgi:Tfp pilus assembly protein PilX
MRSGAYLQRGQVLLIVILVMVVALTIGLSVVSRSITTLRTTKESESSQRAFSAAEAGIESILTSANGSSSKTLTNNSSFSTSITTVSGASLLINNGNAIAQDDGVDVWLSVYPNYTSQFNGTVKIYWGSSQEVCSGSNNTQAALEIVVMTGLSTAPVIKHYAVDPCSARAALNNFTGSVQAGATINGVSYAHSYQVSDAIVNGLIMRIVPLYASTILAVSGNGANLPAQGQLISSVGTSGQASRKITVFKGYPKLPVEFFPYMIFSH